MLRIGELRHAVVASKVRAALKAHYTAHPGARPEVVEIAPVLAEIDASAIAACPDLIRRAATDVAALRDDPTPDDVLLYAAGLAASTA